MRQWGGGFQITVRTDDGEQFSLEVEGEDKTEDVKAKIHDKNGIPLNQQRLNFRSVQLEEGNTLAYYQVNPDDTLNLSVEHQSEPLRTLRFSSPLDPFTEPDAPSGIGTAAEDVVITIYSQEKAEWGKTSLTAEMKISQVTHKSDETFSELGKYILEHYIKGGGRGELDKDEEFVRLVVDGGEAKIESLSLNWLTSPQNKDERIANLITGERDSKYVIDFIFDSIEKKEEEEQTDTLEVCDTLRKIISNSWFKAFPKRRSGRIRIDNLKGEELIKHLCSYNHTYNIDAKKKEGREGKGEWPGFKWCLNAALWGDDIADGNLTTIFKCPDFRHVAFILRKGGLYGVETTYQILLCNLQFISPKEKHYDPTNDDYNKVSETIKMFVQSKYNENITIICKLPKDPNRSHDLFIKLDDVFRDWRVGQGHNIKKMVFELSKMFFDRNVDLNIAGNDEKKQKHKRAVGDWKAVWDTMKGESGALSKISLMKAEEAVKAITDGLAPHAGSELPRRRGDVTGLGPSRLAGRLQGKAE